MMAEDCARTNDQLSFALDSQISVKNASFPDFDLCVSALCDL
jgi:hypothetical protein